MEGRRSADGVEEVWYFPDRQPDGTPTRNTHLEARTWGPWTILRSTSDAPQKYWVYRLDGVPMPNSRLIEWGGRREAWVVYSEDEVWERIVKEEAPNVNK